MQITHTFKQNPVKNGLITAVTALTLLLAGQIIYTSTVDVGAAPGFNSETDPNVLPMLNGFTSLPSSTMQENDAKTEDINNNASTAEIRDAFVTNRYPSTLASTDKISITEAFGPLQQDLENAIAAGEVNAVVNLVNQRQHRLDLDSKWSSSDTAKDVYNFKRPFCTDRNGGLDIIQHTNTVDPPYTPYNGCTLAFPSGHTRYAYTEGVALATMVPELAPQIMARTAEVANNRIVLGMHYPLDTIGGRAIGTRMIAARWHDDAWRSQLEAAKTQLRTALENRCGDTIANCVENGSAQAYMPTAQALDYSTEKLTYGFTRVGTAGQAFQAPDYAYDLLSSTLPDKTPAELNAILDSTAIDSGYPLDTTGQSINSSHVGWTRIDLARALYVAANEDNSTPEPGDVTAPTVSLTSPTNGAIVSGDMNIIATASAAGGVARVDFFIDGVLVGTDNTSPYQTTFDTTSLTNGSHTVTATAYDQANNSSNTSVVVTVANSTGTPEEPDENSFSLTGAVATTFSIDGTCSAGVKDQRLANKPSTLASSNVLIGAAFTVECATSNSQANVSIALDKVYPAESLRVYKQDQVQTDEITDSVTVASSVVGNKAVTVVSYTVVDGGFGDEDGVANSEIADPVFVTLSGYQGAGGGAGGGAGAPNSAGDGQSDDATGLGLPNTGLEKLELVGSSRIILLVVLMMTLAGILAYPRTKEKLTK